MSAQPPGAEEPKRPSVFVVHRPQDRAAAGTLATQLRESFGIDAWHEDWGILGGDDEIAKLEDGLRASDGSVLYVGKAGLEDSWEREGRWGVLYSASLQRSADGGKAERPHFLIPVLQDGVSPDNVARHPLLHARKPVRETALEELARAIFYQVGDTQAPPALGQLWRPEAPRQHELTLRREGDRLVLAYEGRDHSLRLTPAAAAVLRDRQRRAEHEAGAPGRAAEHLRRAGAQLAQILEGGLGEQLASALAAPARREHHVRLCSRELELLALPWEALPIPGLGPLCLIERVSMARELVSYTPVEALAPVPGPLRILIALAAPDDELDPSRELQLILDGVEEAREARARVVFVDEAAATLDGLRQQLDARPFHVVHLSARASEDALWLEGADGAGTSVTPASLAKVFEQVKHLPCMVMLVVRARETAPLPLARSLDALELADRLIAAGVPQVILVRALASEGYAGELTRSFYRGLAGSGGPVASRALATAKRAVEQARREHAERGESFGAPLPEYDSAVFCCAAGCATDALYDSTQRFQEVPEPPPMTSAPGLTLRPLGWMVGRRAVRRALRRELTDRDRKGALIWGMGGAGKSSLVASVLERLQREGWGVVTVVGTLSVETLTSAMVSRLKPQAGVLLSDRGVALLSAGVQAETEREQLAHWCQLLETERVIVCLDNFEDNLALGETGIPASFTKTAGARRRERPPLRASVAHIVRELQAAAKRGSIVITSRYLPERLELSELELGALEPVAARQLAWRLEGLRSLPRDELAGVLAALGGHPRTLEFADALLRVRERERFEAAFPDLRARILKLADELAIDVEDGLTAAPGAAEHRAALETARRLAAEDVLLEALLQTLRDEERTFAGALAVYRRPVSDAAYAEVARAAGLAWSEKERAEALERLRARTLVFRALEARDGARAGPKDALWTTHRWTAAELVRSLPDATRRAVHRAAGQWWLSGSERTWDERAEALEHFIEARAAEEAEATAQRLHTAAQREGASMRTLAICERMSAFVERDTSEWARWLSERGTAASVLGDLSGALLDLQDGLAIRKRLAERDPANTQWQRDLSISYNKLGDLQRALGDGAQALRYFQDGLAIAKRLAERDPASTEWQRDLSISYERLGDLQRALGDGAQALRYAQDSLAIAKRLAERDPENTEWQRDLSISYNKLGDLQRALGDGAQALRYFQDGLAIRKRLAERDPENTQWQRDLSISYDRLGDLQRALGDGAQALRYAQDSLAIRKRLAERDPENTEWQRDLAVVLGMLGDLHRELNKPEAARRAFEQSRAIFETLADQHPGDEALRDSLAWLADQLTQPMG